MLAAPVIFVFVTAAAAAAGAHAPRLLLGYERRRRRTASQLPACLLQEGPALDRPVHRPQEAVPRPQRAEELRRGNGGRGAVAIVGFAVAVVGFAVAVVVAFLFFCLFFFCYLGALSLFVSFAPDLPQRSGKRGSGGSSGGGGAKGEGATWRRRLPLALPRCRRHRRSRGNSVPRLPAPERDP